MSKAKIFVLSFLCLISACSKHQQTEPNPSLPNDATQRTKATLPPVDVPGADSLGFNLYFKGQDGTTTAIGQIFLPPKGHNFLIKVGFLCRHSGSLGHTSDIRVKLRISPWMADRPASATLWESEQTLIANGFDHGWLSFDVPHIELIPNQRYIAWLSMVGLENVDDANFSVVSMGAWTVGPQPRGHEPYKPNSWSYDYPEGARAFWRHGNPDGLVDYMTQSSWTTDGSGENLHFKMIFENRKPNE